MDQLPVTDRTKLRRHPERARFDRAELNAILDAGWIAHVGFHLGDDVPGRAPFVIPTSYVRIDDTLYVHGAVANRMLHAAAPDGIEVCVTVTLLDGLVLARSTFHHSMNYRSAVILGRGRLVLDVDQKARVMAALVDRLIPGRANVARAPTPRELHQTAVMAVPLDEASVKVRTGQPVDDEADVGWPAWAGVIPLAVVSAAVEPAPGTTGAPPARTLAGPTDPRFEIRQGDGGRTTSPPAHTQRCGDWTLSDERARVDFAVVSAWLAGAYWCRGLPRAAVEQSARGSSLVAGAYAPDGAQVGYLRVVSDGTRFANIMDVFVAESQRGRGIGRALVRFALQHPGHRDIPRWLLGTRDAHGVYAHEGFRLLEEPGRVMERKVAAPWEQG